jgi:hypothetical protein
LGFRNIYRNLCSKIVQNTLGVSSSLEHLFLLVLLNSLFPYIREHDFVPSFSERTFRRNPENYESLKAIWRKGWMAIGAFHFYVFSSRIILLSEGEHNPKNETLFLYFYYRTILP